MAVIGKIRERGNLLVILVGGALLLFVLDALLSNRGGRGRGDDTIGSIAGKEINMADFSRRVEDQLEVYRENGTTVNDQLQQSVRENVWNDMVRERTLLVQADNAGFGTTISKDEFDDIRFGDNILPDFRNSQGFQGANGQPDKDKLRTYFENVRQKAPLLFQLQKQTFVPQRIYAKYNMLVKKSCFVNNAQVKQEWAAKNTKANFDFVAKRYDMEPDSLYPVSDEELRRYFDAHHNERKWEQKAARSFEYVRFMAPPTDADVESARKELADLAGDFGKAKGAKADSVFVATYADTKNTVAAAYTPGAADKLNDSLIVNADTGAVVGPFRDGNVFKLVKVAELADVQEARVRHILFTTGGKSPDEEKVIKARADSVLAVVKKDRSKFEAMVTKFSEDPGSKNTGGVYEWFDKKRMVPEFTHASFDEKVGAITICKTSYGYHIVEVLGQRTRKERRVITIDRKVEPMEGMKLAWQKASEFGIKNPDSVSFRKTAKEQGLAITPVPDLVGNSQYVPGLQDVKQVVQWVNHAEPGAKSSEPLVSDESYVVCLLTGIRQDGAPELKDVRETFTKEVRKEKKAEALVAKMTGKTDLPVLAGEIGSQVQNAADLQLSSFGLPGGFNDPAVLGEIFSLPANQVSVPLKGDVGVYVVKMNTVTPAPAEMPKDAEDPKALTENMRRRAETLNFNALKEAAKVVDDRARFF